MVDSFLDAPGEPGASLGVKYHEPRWFYIIHSYPLTCTMSDSESDFEGFEDSDIEFESCNNCDSSDEEQASPAPVPLSEGWSSQLSVSSSPRIFNQDVGPAHPLPAAAREINFFNVLFPPYLFEQIAEETNRNAENKQRRNGRPDRKWKPVSPGEVAAYLGFNMYMGIVNKPGYKYHFSEKTNDEYTDNVGLR